MTLFRPVPDLGVVVDTHFLKEYVSHNRTGRVSAMSPRRPFRDIVEDERPPPRSPGACAAGPTSPRGCRVVSREQDDRASTLTSSFLAGVRLLGLPDKDVVVWAAIKKQMRRAVFRCWPASSQVMEYCIREIRLLPELHDDFWGKF